MRVPTAQELLTIWERGQQQSAPDKALLLLGAACPEIALETLAVLSIGQRDAFLLTLRERLFGTHLNSVVRCQICSEHLELNFSTSEMRVTKAATALENCTPQEGCSLQIRGYDIRFRVPNSQDLLALIEQSNVNKSALLERCVLRIKSRGKNKRAAELPENVQVALSQAMAEADPQADVQLALQCPACQHRWQAAFDILTFLWSELQTWAHRMLREVHLLARAYGWSEADILVMNPGRRHTYLAMIAAR